MKWLFRKGRPRYSSAELLIDAVVSGAINAPAADVWVWDPEGFMVGEPYRHLAIWDRLTHDHPQRDLILGWLKNGISVKQLIEIPSRTIQLPFSPQQVLFEQ